MMKYIEKHWKQILIGITIFTIAFVLIAWWRKNQILDHSTETKLSNPKRNEEAYQDTYYYEQLNEKEKVAYQEIKKAIADFKGGEITFSQPLTGEEYTRVVHAIEYGSQDYYYAIVGVPMDKEDKSLTYDNEDILSVKDESVAKCLIFLASAKDVDKQGKFDDDGYVTNLTEMRKALGEQDPQKVATIENEEEKINSTLNKIIDQMPKEYGTKEAIDYFLKWLDENIEPYGKGINAKTMSSLFTEIYKRNGLVSVIDKESLPTAYAKILSELCNRAGIESHVVLGQWKDGNAYVMTCVKIEGEDIYIDASGSKNKDLWGQKYLTKQEANNVMTPVEYFNYDK